MRARGSVLFIYFFVKGQRKVDGGKSAAHPPIAGAQLALAHACNLLGISDR